MNKMRLLECYAIGGGIPEVINKVNEHSAQTIVNKRKGTTGLDLERNNFSDSVEYEYKYVRTLRTPSKIYLAMTESTSAAQPQTWQEGDVSLTHTTSTVQTLHKPKVVINAASLHHGSRQPDSPHTAIHKASAPPAGREPNACADLHVANREGGPAHN